MKIIRARLHPEIGEGRLAAAVLRAGRPGLHLEFADGFGARAEFVVAPALQVETAERYAFDQNLVGVVLATVDRTLKRAADRAGQAGEDELLNLALPVADRDRPGVELFLGNVPPYLGRASFDQRRLARDGQLFADPPPR